MKISDIASAEIHHLDPEKLRLTLESEYTIKAQPSDDAIGIAARFNDASGGLIVIVDSGGTVSAMVDPNLVREQLEANKGIKTLGFRNALELFEADPIEQTLGFRHEWLNQVRYDPHWCDIGQHYTTLAPCPVPGH